MLEYQGAYVIAVGLMQEAIEILNHIQVDVLLCNLRLLDGDGFQVVQTLPTFISTRSTVAIALTSNSSETLRREAISRGFQACLPKPVDAETLVNTIGQYLELE